MGIRKRGQRYRYLWSLDILLIGVGGSGDEGARILIAEPQHYVGGEIVCRILFATEDWNAQYIEHRVPHLMGKNVEELTHHRIHRGDACRCRSRWQGLQNLSEILIANVHARRIGRSRARLLVPGVRYTIATHSSEFQFHW